MGTALLHRLKEALANDPESITRQMSRRQVSPELPQLIGEVVIAAAWAEDAGGTFLQATSGHWDKRARGYDDTSSRLVKALRDTAPKALVDRLEAALELRHFVVYGVWVNGSFVKHPDTGEPFDFVSMKRRYRTSAPEKDVKAFMKSALKWLAREFWEIGRRAREAPLRGALRQGQGCVSIRVSQFQSLWQSRVGCGCTGVCLLPVRDLTTSRTPASSPRTAQPARRAMLRSGHESDGG